MKEREEILNKMKNKYKLALFMVIRNSMVMPQGIKFGKRDHTTVLHACNKIENEVKENPSTKRIVDSVKNLLTSDK